MSSEGNLTNIAGVLTQVTQVEFCGPVFAIVKVEVPGTEAKMYNNVKTTTAVLACHNTGAYIIYLLPMDIFSHHMKCGCLYVFNMFHEEATTIPIFVTNTSHIPLTHFSHFLA